MELSNRGSYIFKIVFISLLSILCFITLFGGIKNQNINLSKTKKVSGIVENIGIETYTRSKGRKSNDFYIKLARFSKKLTVGRVIENYNDLFSIINKGDSLTIYYDVYDDDLSIIEIQRKNEIILHKSEYEKQSRILAIIGLVGLLSCLSIIHNVRKEYLKSKKSDS